MADERARGTEERRLIGPLLLLLAGSSWMSGCSREESPRARSLEAPVERAAPEALPGHYATQYAGVHLDLAPDGTYFCFFLVQVDTGYGCVVPEGNSRGTWEATGGTVVFHPLSESHDLPVGLHRGTLTVGNDGAVLVWGGRREELPSFRPWTADDGPSAR